LGVVTTDPATERLEELVRAAPLLMRALRAARDVDAPDWLLAAGSIRNAVWDALHDRPPQPPRDLDVLFFDPDDPTPARDTAVEQALRDREPQLPWEARNQASVHAWYPQRFGIEVQPFTASADAVATFPEIASCVGVRLLADDELLVVAPYGLDDLFAGICRHNAARAPLEVHEQRVAEKGWRERWPRVRFPSSRGRP
jgi:uncharacterized protein